MSDLKPCPFCGRKAVKVGFHNGVQCPTAYCAGNAMVVEPSQWNRRAQPDTRKWQPIETAPRKTEILLAWHDGTKWHQDTGWVEDWEPDLSPEQMRWMPLPSLPALRAQQKEGE